MESININFSEDDKIRFPNQDNVGLVQIMNNDQVMLSLSRNAMLGLGEQLIKLANGSFEDGYHVHVDPCERGYLPQVIGFFSHPKSVELIICCEDFKAIETYIK